jgi:D-aminopeptidase
MQPSENVQSRRRLRDLGVVIGKYEPGPLNAITDVDGVLVGHSTVIEGSRIRTGSTAIVPHGGNVFQDRVPAGVSVFNGFGKLAGSTQIQELGEIETPILLTNTLATGRAIDAIHRWTLSQPGNEHVTSINAIVGETNDSRLNDIRAGRPALDEISVALESASSGAVAEGSIGAGTGTVCFGVKGGIGTSSRHVQIGNDSYVIGSLVQTNFGGTLRVDGRPLNRCVGEADKDGSIMIIVATDAPLCDRNLRRLAERAFGGLARTGAAFSNGSGDYALAFSTAPGVRRHRDGRVAARPCPVLPNDLVSPLFESVIETVEESILNSLVMAESIEGYDAGRKRPNRVESIAYDAIIAAIGSNRTL